MDILNDMGIDAGKANHGVWVVLDNVEGDHEVLETEVGDRPAVKIARADNLKHQIAATKRLMAINRSVRRSGLDPEARMRMEAESAYETVILGWQNIQAGGAPFPFTRENVVKVWTDITYAGFKERLNALIQDNELFRLQQQEERTGN